MSGRKRITEADPINACAVCGMPVNDTEGMSVPSPKRPEEFTDGGAAYDRWVARRRFGRRHAGCREGLAYVVGQVLGVSISEDAAAEVCASSGVNPSAIAVGKRAEKAAFDFIGDDQRARLKLAHERWNLKVTPHLCREGACGMCGRSHHVRWIESPLRWSDGTPAPFCGDCHALWLKRGRPRDAEPLRELAREALTGCASMNLPAMGMKCYAEVSGDDRGGHPRPWSYSPKALAEVRERVFVGRPDLIPDSITREIWTRIRDERWAAFNREAEEARRATEPAW